MPRWAALVTALAGFAALPAGAAAASPLTLVPVARLDSPVGVVAAPGDRARLFVVEERGRIAELRGRTTSTFVDLTDRVKADGDEQGLLGLAFAPDYATSGKLYVYYTARPPAGVPAAAGAGDLVVSELRRKDADHADPASERVVLRIPHRGDQYENGGQLAFGPDGRLYVGTGDGGDDNDRFAFNSQRLDPAGNDDAAGHEALLGKLLRIDPAAGDGCGGGCTIPADNPGFAQREVWAYGLRNPWRFSFDPQTGDLTIADVGDGQLEEIDRAPVPALARGVNFGWPYFEGTIAGPVPGGPDGCCTGPVITRSHRADGWNAIIGGVVVRDPGLPALAGRYLYAAFNRGTIRAATVTGGGLVDDVDTGLQHQALTSFGTDGCGRVYITSLDGTLARISQGEGACDAVGVTLTVPGGQHPQRTGSRSGTVRATVACATACRAHAQVSLRVGAAVVGHSAARTLTLRAGKPRTLSLRVSAQARAAVRRALARGRTATARVVVTARATDSTWQRRSTVDTRLRR